MNGSKRHRSQHTYTAKCTQAKKHFSYVHGLSTNWTAQLSYSSRVSGDHTEHISRSMPANEQMHQYHNSDTETSHSEPQQTTAFATYIHRNMLTSKQTIMYRALPQIDQHSWFTAVGFPVLTPNTLVAARRQTNSCSNFRTVTQKHHTENCSRRQRLRHTYTEKCTQSKNISNTLTGYTQTAQHSWVTVVGF